MAFLKKTIPALFIAAVACFFWPAASAEDAVKEFRIGLISADPGQLLRDFDPFVNYLGSRLRPSGMREATVFVAKDLEQLRGRIKEGKLDFVLTSAFPIVEMEPNEVVPAVVAVQGGVREYSAVFFVRKESPLHDLSDLRGKTVVCGTPSSTAGFALAKAELKKHQLSFRDATDIVVPADAVRYRFAGEAINQAYRVIRDLADAGVFSSSDWDGLPPRARSQLRIMYRTAPITRLLGSFHTSVPLVLREAVEKALVDMSGDRKGQAALARALHMTRFERLTEEDRNSLQGLKLQLQEADKK